MIKLNALLTILTITILANTEAGAVKLVCWLGLFVEFIIFTMIFEKDLQ
jgi:hypothetical protein